MKPKQLIAALIGLALAGIFATAFGCGETPTDEVFIEDLIARESSATIAACGSFRSIPGLGSTPRPANFSNAFWTPPNANYSASPATVNQPGSLLQRSYPNYVSWNAPVLVSSPFTSLLWTNPSAAPVAGGVGGCQVYFASTGPTGRASWPDGSQTILLDWAYKIFIAAPGQFKWREKLDLPTDFGNPHKTLQILGGVAQ